MLDSTADLRLMMDYLFHSFSVVYDIKKYF